MTLKISLLLLCLSSLLSGCYQVSSDDMRNVPVTNNPNIVPHPNSDIGMPY